MGAGDHYRLKAIQIGERGKARSDPAVRAEYQNLSLAYWRLADIAERSAKTDIVYETPPQKDAT
jgi:hypothetical protein